MRYFEKIASGINVAPIMAKLDAHPELWDANPMRRTYPNSPHRDMKDIWVRARAPTGDGLRSYSERHESVWWPAADAIPEMREIAIDLAIKVNASQLGGVLITKVPAGKKIHPHNDSGFWHATHYNRKVYVCIQGNDHCTVWCEDERVVMRNGEAWLFENLVTHGLDNDGDTDRISAIFAMRSAL